MYQKIKEYFEVHKQEMLDDIMAAIRIPSVNGPEKPGMPFGEENAKVLAFAASLAKELGLKAEVLENKVAVIDLNEQPAELDILAHLDVVPAGDGWTVTEPFVPVIRDGRLYGRGSSDDKGPAIAALYAMKAVKDLGVTLTKNARLILGADEETACRDTEYYYSKGRSLYEVQRSVEGRNSPAEAYLPQRRYGGQCGAKPGGSCSGRIIRRDNPGYMQENGE